MSERPDPHTAVMRELLVRYLDAWTPAVLRSHRRATYVEGGRGCGRQRLDHSAAPDVVFAFERPPG